MTETTLPPASRYQDGSQKTVLIDGVSVTYQVMGGEWVKVSESSGSVDTSASYQWTGTHTWDISGGKSFIVSDDVTLAAPTQYFGFFDHSVIPTAMYSAFGAKNSTGNCSSNYQSQLNDDGSVARYFNVSNASGGATESTIVTSAGVSTRSIMCDVFEIDAIQKHSGYKTGTLASPPSGMVIGEVWADTTDSATHPIYRISTVTT